MNLNLIIPELGHLAMILALCLALVQATLPLIGAWRGDRQWMSLAVPAAWGQQPAAQVDTFADVQWHIVFFTMKNVHTRCRGDGRNRLAQMLRVGVQLGSVKFGVATAVQWHGWARGVLASLQA